MFLIRFCCILPAAQPDRTGIDGIADARRKEMASRSRDDQKNLAKGYRYDLFEL